MRAQAGGERIGGRNPQLWYCSGPRRLPRRPTGRTAHPSPFSPAHRDTSCLRPGMCSRAPKPLLRPRPLLRAPLPASARPRSGNWTLATIVEGASCPAVVPCSVCLPMWRRSSRRCREEEKGPRDGARGTVFFFLSLPFSSSFFALPPPTFLPSSFFHQTRLPALQPVPLTPPCLPCRICRPGGETFAVCTTCGLSYHTNCLSPPIPHLYRCVSWVCPLHKAENILVRDVRLITHRPRALVVPAARSCSPSLSLFLFFSFFFFFQTPLAAEAIETREEPRRAGHAGRCPHCAARLSGKAPGGKASANSCRRAQGGATRPATMISRHAARPAVPAS